MKNKKILIIGAGISGLSLAINLKKLKILFRIIEKQTKWNKIGLAMSIQGEGLNAAANLGILEEINSPGEKRNLQRIENSRRKILKEMKTVLDDPGFVIRRDILHKALRLRVPEVEMDLSVLELKEIQAGLNVTLSDGSRDNFSLAVGADGINSETSKQMVHNSKIPDIEKNTTYSGSVLWGITVSKKYKEIIEIWNTNKMIALYPVDHGTVISFFRKAPETFQSPRLERALHIKKYFSNFTQGIIQDLLKNLPKDIFFDHVRYTRPQKWNIGRITLIGDACHSMSPLSGLGANLAMADATGLAQVIKESETNRKLLDQLKIFNKNRKDKADAAFLLSKYRTRRGMAGFPESLIRNIKMQQKEWKY